MIKKHVYIISLIYTRLCICVILVVVINFRFLFICGLIIFVHTCFRLIDEDDDIIQDREVDEHDYTLR